VRGLHRRTQGPTHHRTPIIRNLQHEDNEYTGGDILDPESGSVYRCKMHLEQDGTRLVVRGFIGFSLLGRSQTWQRQYGGPWPHSRRTR
jgi:uncharacterized protein (DUF2147 family)